MERTFFLSLDPSQADQLSWWCARYRSYAWQHLEPTPERNQVMKVAQAVQGRISALRSGGAEARWLMISADEKQALRHLISTLIQASGAEAASEDRNRVLGELASLRIRIERMAHQTESLETERREAHYG